MPHKPKMIWINCEICGKPKEVEHRILKRGHGRFCGRSCASKWLTTVKGHPAFGAGLTGEDNPNWKGGRTEHARGYIYKKAYGHPRAWQGYVLEHILVAEQMLGRPLKPEEVVHHKNRKKWDNRPENLAVFASTADHTKYHAGQEIKAVIGL